MKQTEENWFIFTPGSLQYCSQNYCTVVPEMTVFLFAEITAFLFPVYRYLLSSALKTGPGSLAKINLIATFRATRSASNSRIGTI